MPLTLDSDSDSSFIEEDVHVEAPVLVDDSETEVVDIQCLPERAYTIKLINPTCKKDFCSIELGKGKTYNSVASLQKFITKGLSTNPKFKASDMKNVEMGYVR